MDQQEIQNLSEGIRAFHEGHYDTAIKLLMPLAERGNVEAQYNVANLYLSGEGGKYKPNYDEALKWLKLSAEQDHPQALQELGNLHFYGEGVEQNKIKGISLYKRAVELDYALAKSSLGWILVFDNDIERDLDDGLRLLNEAMSQGEVTASYLLGLIHHKGVKDNDAYLMRPDISEAIKLYKNAADKENADAAYNLFHLYFHGEEIEQDNVRALKYLKMGADNYHGPSQYQLGNFYQNGILVDKDLSQAERYFMLSAFKGDNEARVAVGIAIEQQIDEGAYDAEGLEEYKQSQIDWIFKWLNYAADEKYPLALHQLGIRYATGNKIEQDYKKAISFFKQAHDLGFEESTNSLGIMYLQGEGVDKDEAKALEYFKAAALKGVRPSQTNSAIMLEELAKSHPEGSEENADLIRESLSMLQLAADQGHIPSKYNFARLCIQNTIHKDIAKDPFSVFGKEDFLPYLKDAAAADYEQAKALLELFTKASEAEEIREKIKTESTEFDKFFRKNKIRKITDLSKIINKNDIITFFDSLIKNEDKEILIYDLLKLCNLNNFDYEEFKIYLEIKDFISTSDYSNFVNAFDLIGALEGFDLTRILHTVRKEEGDENSEVSSIIEDEYWIFNDLENENQYLLKFFEDTERTKILLLDKKKKYTTRNLKKIFEKEQLLFNEEISQIFFHRRLLDKGDDGVVRGWGSKPIKKFSYFKPLREKLKNISREYLLDIILCYPSTSTFPNSTLPMNKKDCISFIKEDPTTRSNLSLMQEKFKSDKDIVKLAVSFWGWNINYADKNLRNNPEIKTIASKNIKKEKTRILKDIKKGIYYDFLSQYDQMLTSDRDIVLAAVKVHGRILEDVDPIFKKDKEVVLAACKNKGDMIFEADKKLQNDKEVVHAALNNDPSVLFGLTDKFKLNYDLNHKVISKNGSLVEQINKKFLKNKDILIAAINSEAMEWDDIEASYSIPALITPILTKFDKSIINDEEIILLAIKKDMKLKDKVINYYQKNDYESFLDVTLEDDLHHYVSELIFPFIENKNFMKKVARVYPQFITNYNGHLSFDTDLLKAAGHNSTLHSVDDLNKEDLEKSLNKILEGELLREVYSSVGPETDDKYFKLHHTHCEKVKDKISYTIEEYTFDTIIDDNIEIYAKTENYLFENKFPYELIIYSQKVEAEFGSTKGEVSKNNQEYILKAHYPQTLEMNENGKQKIVPEEIKIRKLENFTFNMIDFFVHNIFLQNQDFISLFDRIKTKAIVFEGIMGLFWEEDILYTGKSILFEDRSTSEDEYETVYMFRNNYDHDEYSYREYYFDKNGAIVPSGEISKRKFIGLKKRVIDSIKN